MSNLRQNSVRAFDLGITYSSGALVLDRDGIWQATTSNTNSRPVSGNTDWELIGGRPYVDIVLDPVTLTTLPFYEPAQLGTGLVLIPAPRPDEYLIPCFRISAQMSLGTAWNGNLFPNFYLWNPDTPEHNSTVLMESANGGSQFYLPLSGEGGDPITGVNADNLRDIMLDNSWTAEVDNKTAAHRVEEGLGLPLTMFSVGALVGEEYVPLTGGSTSVVLRVYYDIQKWNPLTFPHYFIITAIDQGTKTITVSDDASALTGSIVVVGSTANDGTYTIISVTFDTDHTDIVVIESIPNATADGWVEQ